MSHHATMSGMAANAEPTRLPELARELAAQKPDLLIGVGGDVVRALVDASNGTPVVGGVSDNPVRAGIALAFARAGKIFTGVTFLTDEMAAKRMELLNEVAATARRVAVVWNPQHLDDEMLFARRAAETLGISLTSHPLSKVAEADVTLREAGVSGAEALFVIPSRTTNIAAGKIAQAENSRLSVSPGTWRKLSPGKSPRICQSRRRPSSSWKQRGIPLGTRPMAALGKCRTRAFSRGKRARGG